LLARLLADLPEAPGMTGLPVGLLHAQKAGTRAIITWPHGSWPRQLAGLHHASAAWPKLAALVLSVPCARIVRQACSTPQPVYGLPLPHALANLSVRLIGSESRADHPFRDPGIPHECGCPAHERLWPARDAAPSVEL
jgi:hypothetical protein